MSAKFVDALKGYEYYLSQAGKASRYDINQYLEREGRTPISARTYGHYEGLRSHGFCSYIPINKFDVFQALGQLQMAADRRRYSRAKIALAASVSTDGERWLPVTLVDKSLVGFGGVTSSRLSVKPGHPILVRIEGFEDIPSILVWIHAEKNLTRFGIRAVEFVAKYDITRPTTLPARLTGKLTVRRTSESGLIWSELFRILSKVNELFAATDDLIYALAELAGKRIRLASPVVSSIKLASPGDVQVKIDLGVAEIIKVVLEKLQFWGWQKRRHKAETRKVELENANLQIELIRNAVKLKREAAEAGLSQELIGALGQSVLDVLGIPEMPHPLFGPTSLETGILKERLLPAAVELVAGDDPDFEVEVETPKC
jgi:hypothetical protein